MARRNQGAEGFTLIEALLAAAILAIAVTAVLLPFTAGMHSQAVDLRQTMAVGLAQELMEEILSKAFEEPDDADDLAEPTSRFGPEADETARSAYDAIDDYSAYSENAGAILGPDGAVVTDPTAGGLSRHVSVAYVTVSGQDTAGEPRFLRVTVEVRHMGVAIVTLTRLVHWLK